MKKFALLLLTLCLLLLPGCGAEEVADLLPVPEALVIADFDLSGVTAVEIYSGSTGKIQRFTDADTVSAVLAAIRPIEGSEPISSWGYFATFYVLKLYAADNEPLLDLSLVKPSDHQHFVGHGVYETINGFDYRALYTVDQAQFDAILALCDSLMGEVPVTTVPASSEPRG